MTWTDFLNDNNRQNENAANAGDGPKHIAWLTFMEILGDKLKTVVETHSGGGIYKVPQKSFCVDLPKESILGNHQISAGLPEAEGEQVYYSASGDQALKSMPQECRYIAFETNPTTAGRLIEVATWRERQCDLDRRAYSYRGHGGAGADSLNTVLRNVPKPCLTMVDPSELDDLENASNQIRDIKGIRSILFGVGRKRYDANDNWNIITGAFNAHHRITWRWKGNRCPGENSQFSFFLLITTPDGDESTAMFKRLNAEHQILRDFRGHSHAYDSNGPQRVI